MQTRKQQIKNLLAAGKTVEQMAEIIGVPRVRIIQSMSQMRRRDGDTSAPYQRNESGREDVIGLLEQGLSRAEVAQRLGITRSTVSTHVATFRKNGMARMRATEFLPPCDESCTHWSQCHILVSIGRPVMCEKSEP